MSEEVIQETGSQEATPSAAEIPASFHESLPETLRNDPSLRHVPDVATLAKNYVNAQSMIGADKVVRPSKNWTDEQYDNFYSSIGRPESVDGYEGDFGSFGDDEGMGKFKQAAWEAGLQPRQLTRLMQFFEEASTMGAEQTTQAQEAAVYEAEMELRKEFGQAYDQKLIHAQNAARTVLGEQGMDIFSDVTLSDGRSLGDHPDVVKMFAKLGDMIGEDNLVGEPTEMIMTPAEAKSRIAEMTRRDGPYFDKMHPEHDTYIEEVLRLREFL